MDELIARLVANVGVDRAVAEKSVGIILAFLINEGPADKVQALMDKLPGAEAAAQNASIVTLTRLYYKGPAYVETMIKECGSKLAAMHPFLNAEDMKWITHGL